MFKKHLHLPIQKKVYVIGNETISWKETEKGYQLQTDSGIYIQTHMNHPCCIWTRKSLSNWIYLYELMIELEKEWQYRFDKKRRHKSVESLESANILNLAKEAIKDRGFTNPALAMPEIYQDINNPIESYKQYYINEKQHLLKYTKREIPIWLRGDEK